MSKNYNEDIEQIRSMMERSSRFISLSGLSGIFTGLVGCVAAVLLYSVRSELSEIGTIDAIRIRNKIVLIPLISMLVAFAGASFFTIRKTKRNNLPVWSALTKRILINFLIPLAAGGIFCLALLNMGLVSLLIPTTLIFYGLALFNVGKFTFRETSILAVGEIILGFSALFLPQFGIWIWGIGFGLFHILYGLIVQRKYH